MPSVLRDRDVVGGTLAMLGCLVLVGCAAESQASRDTRIPAPAPQVQQRGAARGAPPQENPVLWIGLDANRNIIQMQNPARQAITFRRRPSAANRCGPNECEVCVFCTPDRAPSRAGAGGPSPFDACCWCEPCRIGRGTGVDLPPPFAPLRLDIPVGPGQWVPSSPVPVPPKP
jgi:hypothetical protein